MTGRLPGDDYAGSYNGEYTLSQCTECGKLAYLPPESFDGTDGHCTTCEKIVEWSKNA